MIDGHTELVGLIGWPVGHSLSPAMHNVAFDALGLNWRYVPLPVPPGQVAVAIRGLVAMGFRGANVTVPHKEAALATLDYTSSDAKALGAVNTLVIERQGRGESSIGGLNTDVQGFVGALRRSGFDPESGGTAVVVGAGGAARAVIFGLLGSGIDEIVLLNRTLGRARALITDIGRQFQDAGQMRALPLTQETLIESSRTAGLLVNATIVGMWPHVNNCIWPDGVAVPAHLVVFDLVYNPVETELLRRTRESGSCAIDGLGMLVRQGALSFARWVNKGIDVTEITGTMRAVCEEFLRK